MKPEICMLARSWEAHQDPTGWFMSEKLDGIRMIRPRGNLDVFSREGNPFHPPAWWLDQLPRGLFLDGEAWIGRGQFRMTQSILERKTASDAEWRQVKFMCIEPFLLPAGPPYCIVEPSNPQSNTIWHPIPQIVCASRAHLQSFYDSVLAAGGEGVILRHPRQPYHTGRSPYLLRVKPEIKGTATVISYNMGLDIGSTGAPPVALGAPPNASPFGVPPRLISLHCHCVITRESPADRLVEFDLSNGLTEETRANPPPIGSEIHFLYQCLSDAGKPMFVRLAKSKT